MVDVSEVGSRFRSELIARIVIAVSGGLLTLLLARILEPEAYGLLYWAISFVGITRLFAKLGVGSSAARYITEYKADDESAVPGIIRFSLTVTLILCFTVAGFVFVLNEQLAVLIGNERLAPYFIIAAPFVITTTVSGYMRNVLQGFENIQGAALVSTVRGLSKLLLGVGFGLVLGGVGALIGFALSAGIGASVGGVIIYRQYYRSEVSPTGIGGALKRRIVEYALPLTATEGARVIDKEIDTVLVGFFLNSVAVSYYVIGKQVTRFVQTPVSALGFTLAPTFGSQKSEGNQREAARLYEQALVNSLLLYLPAVVGLILVADPMIHLFFGTRYAPAAPVLQILCIFVLLQSVNQVAAKSLDFLGRARSRAIVKGISALLNAGLNVILIPEFGVVGAAFATVVTHFLYVAANLVVLAQELPVRAGHVAKQVLGIAGISSVMGLVVFSLLNYVNGIVSLLSVVAVGFGTWVALATLTGMLDIQTALHAVASTSSADAEDDV